MVQGKLSDKKADLIYGVPRKTITKHMNEDIFALFFRSGYTKFLKMGILPHSPLFSAKNEKD